MKKYIIALFALMMLAPAAQAAVITYDLTGSAATVTSLSPTSGGVTVAITSNTSGIRINGNGIGASDDPEGGRLGAGEVLTFDFGTTTIDQISGLMFEANGEAERFGVTVNGLSAQFTLPAGPGNSFTSIDFSSLIPVGGVSSFSIFGIEPNAAGNRGVKVAGITVNTLPVPAIPLPAGGILLLSGLGLMASRRRWH